MNQNCLDLIVPIKFESKKRKGKILQFDPSKIDLKGIMLISFFPGSKKEVINKLRSVVGNQTHLEFLVKMNDNIFSNKLAKVLTKEKDGNLETSHRVYGKTILLLSHLYNTQKSIKDSYNNIKYLKKEENSEIFNKLEKQINDGYIPVQRIARELGRAYLLSKGLIGRGSEDQIEQKYTEIGYRIIKDLSSIDELKDLFEYKPDDPAYIPGEIYETDTSKNRNKIILGKGLIKIKDNFFKEQNYPAVDEKEINEFKKNINALSQLLAPSPQIDPDKNRGKIYLKDIGLTKKSKQIQLRMQNEPAKIKGYTIDILKKMNETYELLKDDKKFDEMFTPKMIHDLFGINFDETTFGNYLNNTQQGRLISRAMTVKAMITRLKDFISSKGDSSKPLFWNQETYRNARSGYIQNILNVQADKIFSRQAIAPSKRTRAFKINSEIWDKAVDYILSEHIVLNDKDTPENAINAILKTKNELDTLLGSEYDLQDIVNLIKSNKYLKDDGIFNAINTIEFVNDLFSQNEDGFVKVDKFMYPDARSSGPTILTAQNLGFSKMHSELFKLLGYTNGNAKIDDYYALLRAVAGDPEFKNIDIFKELENIDLNSRKSIAKLRSEVADQIESLSSSDGLQKLADISGASIRDVYKKAFIVAMYGAGDRTIMEDVIKELSDGKTEVKHNIENLLQTEPEVMKSLVALSKVAKATSDFVYGEQKEKTQEALKMLHDITADNGLELKTITPEALYFIRQEKGDPNYIPTYEELQKYSALISKKEETAKYSQNEDKTYNLTNIKKEEKYSEIAPLVTLTHMHDAAIKSVAIDLFYKKYKEEFGTEYHHPIFNIHDSISVVPEAAHLMIEAYGEATKKVLTNSTNEEVLLLSAMAIAKEKYGDKSDIYLHLKNRYNEIAKERKTRENELYKIPNDAFFGQTDGYKIDINKINKKTTPLGSKTEEPRENKDSSIYTHQRIINLKNSQEEFVVLDGENAFDPKNPNKSKLTEVYAQKYKFTKNGRIRKVGKPFKQSIQLSREDKKQYGETLKDDKFMKYSGGGAFHGSDKYFKEDDLHSFIGDSHIIAYNGKTDLEKTNLLHKQDKLIDPYNLYKELGIKQKKHTQTQDATANYFDVKNKNSHDASADVDTLAKLVAKIANTKNIKENITNEKINEQYKLGKQNNKAYKIIYNALSNNGQLLNIIPLVRIFFAKTNKYTIKDGQEYISLKNMDERTIVHEFTHAAVTSYIHANPKDKHVQVLHSLLSDKNIKKMSKAGLKKSLEHIAKYENGYDRVSEFVAIYNSNPLFKKMIPTVIRKTVEKILHTINNFLFGSKTDKEHENITENIIDEAVNNILAKSLSEDFLYSKERQNAIEKLSENDKKDFYMEPGEDKFDNIEMDEELKKQVHKQYNDLLKDGYSEEQAYNIVYATINHALVDDAINSGRFNPYSKEDIYSKRVEKELNTLGIKQKIDKEKQYSNLYQFAAPLSYVDNAFIEFLENSKLANSIFAVTKMTASKINQELLKRSPLYEQILNNTMRVVNTSAFITHLFTDERLSNKLYFDKLNGLYEKIGKASKTLIDNGITRYNEITKNLKEEDRQIIDFFTTRTPLHIFASSGVLAEAIGRWSIDDMNRIYKSISKRERERLQKIYDYTTGSVEADRIIDPDKNNINSYIYNEIGIIDKTKVEKMFVYFLSKDKNKYFVDILRNNTKIQDELFSILSNINYNRERIEGNRIFLPQTASNIFYKKQNEIKVIEAKELEQYKNSNDWKVLREPTANTPGIVYRPTTGASIQNTLGTNLSVNANELIYKGKKIFGRGVSIKKIGNNIEQVVYLSHKEKQELGLLDNTDALYRTLGHLNTITDSKLIRDGLISNIVIQRINSIYQLRNFERFLSFADKKQIKWFLSLSDDMKEILQNDTEDEFKNIKSMFTEPEVKITRIGDLDQHIDMVRKDAEHIITGYNTRELKVSPDTKWGQYINKALTLEKFFIKILKIKWTVINPAKIIRDGMSNISTLAMLGVPMPYSLSKFKELTVDLPKYNKLQLDMLNLKIKYKEAIQNQNTNLAKQINKKINIIKKQKESMPISIMDKYGMIESLATELIERDSENISGVEQEFDNAIDTILQHTYDKNKKSILEKSIKFFMQHGFSMHQATLMVSKGVNHIELLKPIAQKLEQSSSKLKQIEEDGDVRSYIKEVFGLPGSEAIKYGSSATMLMDLYARYSYFNYMLQKGVNVDEAASKTLDAFINYRMNNHPLLKTLDDYGIMPFSYYATKIPKVIWNILHKNPASEAAVLTFETIMGYDENIFNTSLIRDINGKGSLFHNPLDSQNIENVFIPIWIKGLLELF